MKTISVMIAALFTMGLLAGGAMAQTIEHPMGAGWAAQFEQQRVQAIDDIRNYSLRDAQGADLGRIDQVLVDMQRGQVGYVVVQSPTGESHVIPFNALQVDPAQETLTLQMDADRFRQAPTGDAQVVQDLNQAEQIHQFYGVSPYWEDGATDLERRTPTRQSPERQTPGVRELPPAGPKPPGSGIR
jgi:hypothetical protein